MLSKNAKKYIVVAAAAVTGCAILTSAFDTRLSVVNYDIYSNKIKSDIRIAFISDLHNCLYGKNQSQLISAITAHKPDIVILGGDIADKTKYDEPINSYLLAQTLAKLYPCYYTMGNHEYARGDSKAIKRRLSDFGITVLEGNGEVINVNGSEIEICGIFDSYTYNEENGELVNQLKAVSADKTDSIFRMLSAHFPEQIEEYLSGGFDLILSGHAHGGQWRIPFILNGFYAPGQGLFPKYAGGLYRHGKTSHIVSRGLWKQTELLSVPRIYNRPELVIIDIKTNI